MEHEVRNIKQGGRQKQHLGAICVQMCSQILYLLGYMTQSTNHIPWSLLDDLLVPPLNGAFSLIDVDLEIYDDHSPYSCYGNMCK